MCFCSACSSMMFYTRVKAARAGFFGCRRQYTTKRNGVVVVVVQFLCIVLCMDFSPICFNSDRRHFDRWYRARFKAMVLVIVLLCRLTILNCERNIKIYHLKVNAIFSSRRKLWFWEYRRKKKQFHVIEQLHTDSATMRSIQECVCVFPRTYSAIYVSTNLNAFVVRALVDGRMFWSDFVSDNLCCFWLAKREKVLHTFGL